VNNNRILSTISLCKRAGKLLLGFDVVGEAILSGEAKVVIIASDLSPKTQKEVELAAQKGGVRVLPIPSTMDEIWQFVNKRAGVLAVSDQGLAGKLCGLIDHQDKEDECL
jgi:ribosomal protein L7Ae-like RNA K-turn-binding protein